AAANKSGAAKTIARARTLGIFLFLIRRVQGLAIRLRATHSAWRKINSRNFRARVNASGKH
ncbi:MAG TPA: hypothetical protein VMT22_20910, partial [Terriglobales bacterium]|nr:hypothetical protein [Terriglobales bacterium]